MAQLDLALMSSLLLLTTWLHPLDAHGRLWDPPARSSMWRRGFDTPINYQDNELYCGGFEYQLSQGYKCGICGDPYDKARENEASGRYATGTISRTFRQGQSVDFQVHITANHKGFFEFKLCPTNHPEVRASQDCLDRNPVPLADGSGFRFYPTPEESRIFNVSVVLPPGLICRQCVLQWRYHTGNRWGTDEDGTSCVGCGPQEEFYGCADVTILGEDQEALPTTSSHTPGGSLFTSIPESGTSGSGSRTTERGTTGRSTTRHWRSESRTTQTSTTNSYPTRTTENSNTGATASSTVGPTGGKGSTRSTDSFPYNTGSRTEVDGDSLVCQAVAGSGADDLWCQASCQIGFCPESHCTCVKTPYLHSVDRPKGCRGAGAYAIIPGQDDWCRRNCVAGNCPSSRCTCS